MKRQPVTKAAGNERISTDQMRERLREKCDGKEDTLRDIDQMGSNDVSLAYAFLFPRSCDPTTVHPSRLAKIAQKAVNLVEGTPYKDLEKIVSRVRPYIAEYRKIARYDTNEECFVALELFVRREAVLSRIRTLQHKMEYRRLCKDRDETVRLVRLQATQLPPADVDRVLTLVNACYNDIAGVLFQLPRLIPLAELKEPSPSTITDLTWSEPLPIVIDEGNSEAVKWHLMPDLPPQDIVSSTQSCFLWGRRSIVSLPIDEWLKGTDAKRKVLSKQLVSMLSLLLKENLSSWETFSVVVQEATKKVMHRRLQALDKAIESATGISPGKVAVLRAVRRQYDLVDLYYKRQRGVRRVRTVRHRKAGVPYTQDTGEIVSKLMFFSDRIAEANKGISDRASSARTATSDEEPVSRIENKPAAATQSPIERLDVLEWMKEQLEQPDVDDKTVKTLIRRFVAEFNS